MFSPSHLKTMHPLQLKSSSSPSSSSPSSTISSMKLKRIIHTLLVSHMCRIIRALSKVKQVIVEILKDDNRTIHLPSSQKKHYKRNKIILGSFRLHYNWCSSKSSHVLPVPQPVYDEGLYHHPGSQLCFESAQNSNNNAVNNNVLDEDCPESQLAGYLRWLEEKKNEVQDDGGDSKGSSANDEQEMNEIDVLAEMFIANCHEKFRLEKQESDRRFQEMLARSM